MIKTYKYVKPVKERLIKQELYVVFQINLLNTHRMELEVAFKNVQNKIFIRLNIAVKV
jgi:hypothetical protein